MPKLMHRPAITGIRASRSSFATQAEIDANARYTSKLFIFTQMIACVAGIYICFGAWSLKQERLMTIPYTGSDGEAEAYFPTVFGVSCAQCVAGALVASLILSGGALVRRVQALTQPQKHGSFRDQEGSSPVFAATPTSDSAMGLDDVRLLIVVGFANAFGTTLGYASMRRLPFPVVLATKMSKMVPVMVVGFACYGTRYSLRKVLSCAAMTTGILGFYLLEEHSAKPRGGSANTASGGKTAAGGVGFLLLFANLFLDGFANSTQDVLVRRRGWGATALMLAANTAAASWSLAVMGLLDSEWLARLATALLPHSLVTPIAFGDLSATLRFLRAYPAARRDLLEMCALNAVGQIFIFQTISLFGTLTLTAMTLVRKAGSVLLSIFVHGHAVSRPQWFALALLMGSVVFEAHVNVTETSEKRRRESSVWMEKKDA